MRISARIRNMGAISLKQVLNIAAFAVFLAVIAGAVGLPGSSAALAQEPPDGALWRTGYINEVAPVNVVVIPVEGFIDGGLFDSIKRRVAEARRISPALIIFRIDTYGGAVEFAMEITDFIGNIETPKTIAYVPSKAYSAGAMIAMAAREIVMAPNASMGDAAPVSWQVEAPEILGEKIQSPIRNVFRKYAERNGYPVPLAEAMVTPEIEVYEVTFADGTKKYIDSLDFDNMTQAQKDTVKEKRVIDAKDRILTMSAAQARDYGFVRFIARDQRELLADYGMAAANVITLESNWSESLVRALNHPAVAGLILMIGIIGLYMEFKVPGFGLPGIVAIICFATFFFSKYLSGMAEYWEIIIFVVGMILLGIEIFLIPGFGITGFAGIAMMVFGMVLVMVPRHITASEMDMDFLYRTAMGMATALVGSFVAGVILAKILPKTPLVGALYLGAPVRESVAHRGGAGITEGKHYVGQIGKAFSVLRPAGKAIIGAEILDVTTQGEMVAKDARIEVIAQRSNNIIVKEVR